MGRRIHTEEHRKAVALESLTGGVRATARKHGVGRTTLVAWRKEYCPEAPSEIGDERGESGRFAVGHSGNPSGGTAEAAQARVVAQRASLKAIQALADMLEAEMAKDEEDRNVETVRRLCDSILDRGLSKLKAVEMSGPGGAPLNTGVDLGKLDDDQLRQLAGILRAARS